MTHRDVDDATWRRLQDRAVEANCSVNDLLQRWLNDEDAGKRRMTQVLDQLHQSESRLRSLIDSQTAFVVRTDIEGRFTYVNDAWRKKFGWLCDDFIGRYSLDTILPIDHDKAFNTVMMCLVHPGEPVQVRLRKPSPDGTPVWTLWEFVAIRDDNGELSEIQCIGFDITQGQQAEEALREREEHYRALVEHTHQGMLIAQINPLRLSFASSPMEAIIGYTPDELTRLTPDEIVARVHPEDRERLINNLNTRLEGQDTPRRARYRIIHKNGSIRHVDFYSTLVEVHGEPASQTAVMDVTDQVESERLKARFQQEKDHNALMQQVITMLSHDLRTPLAVIVSARDILANYDDRLDEEKRREKLATIGRQIHLVLEMLEDAVNVARGNLDDAPFKPQAINLATLCQVSVEETRATQGGKHTIRFVNHYTAEIATIDEVLVSRILINLLSNAIKYSPDGGEIRLELDGDPAGVILRVSDEGMGINESDLPHIFEPLYRSPAVAGIYGTGLGLSIVRDCVERHHGQIQVESVLGRGSTFAVRLPLR